MQDVIKLRAEGITLKEIGSYYGVTDQALCKAISRYKKKVTF
jgi:DNA-directed RNA polymerase specialized sigma subunit